MSISAVRLDATAIDVNVTDDRLSLLLPTDASCLHRLSGFRAFQTHKGAKAKMATHRARTRNSLARG